MPSSLLIDNATVVSTGGTPSIRRGHSILIENGLVAKVAPAGLFPGFAGRRIDASGKVAIPGLINGHTHLYSAFARGLSGLKEGRTFPEVLKHFWWRLDSALATDDCYYSALVGLLDAIRHGTTTIIDHHASPRAVAGSLEAIARAVGKTGVRACLCYEVSDRDGARVAAEGLAENAAFIRRCRARNGGSNLSVWDWGTEILTRDCFD